MDQLDQLVAQAGIDFAAAVDGAALEAAKARYLGKGGSLTELLKGLGKLDPEARKTAGAEINKAKTAIEAALEGRRDALRQAALELQLAAEALANAPPGPTRALRLAGASGSQAFLYGTLPGAAPQLIAYTLYRWEMNIRMAAILGFVGAGGLGQLLYFELSLFHYAQAATVILAMLLLSVAVDQSSAWLRRVMR